MPNNQSPIQVEELNNQAQAMATYNAMMSSLSLPLNISFVSCFSIVQYTQRFYLFIRYYYYPSTLRHTLIKRERERERERRYPASSCIALLSTLRAEVKAEQRMCFIGTFCTIAAPFLTHTTPQQLIAVNERGIAARDGGGGARTESRGQQGATNGGTVKFHPHRRRHCCALATAGIDVPHPLSP